MSFIVHLLNIVCILCLEILQDLKDYCRPHAEVTYADAHKKERGVA